MRRLFILITAGLAIVVAVTVAVTIAVTGEDAPAKLSRAQWERQVIDAGVDRNADFDALENLAREDCERDEDAWGMYLSLSGVEPDVVRLGLEYMCPEQVKVMEAGQEGLDDAVSEVGDACDTPPGQRSAKQQRLAEAMGC